MIDQNDVVRIKMPFPDLSSDLAVKSHMYICHHIEKNTFCFVKCQTLKPYMLISNPINHYWDETPDISRNPFQKTTRIDCDKEFVTSNVRYDDRLKTTRRPNVSHEVMTHIKEELICDGYISNMIAENDLLSLNHLIYKIQ